MNDQFLKFYENIKLTPSQREDAITKHTGVCKKLHDNYYPTIEYNGDTKLLIGSYGKHTHIRPARDIDVIFIMPPEKFEQYDDNQSNSQSQILQDIKNILGEKYPNTPIKAFGKVVVLEFADTSFYQHGKMKTELSKFRTPKMAVFGSNGIQDLKFK